MTESNAVSVEWPLLKPDCLASSLLFCERNLVEDNSFECFGYECKERDRSVVFYKRSVQCRLFEQWGYPSLLECSGEDACEERCVDNVCECW